MRVSFKKEDDYGKYFSSGKCGHAQTVQGTPSSVRNLGYSQFHIYSKRFGYCLRYGTYKCVLRQRTFYMCACTLTAHLQLIRGHFVLHILPILTCMGTKYM